MLEISNLQLKFIDEIASLECEWWNKPNFDYEFVKKRLQKMLESTNLPQMYTLIKDKQLIGFYEIELNDCLSNYPEYKPLLSNLYIKSAYRNQGYGSILIKDVLKRVQSLGYKRLYLHSKHHGLYEKFGFQYQKDVIGDDGKTKRIYSIDL